MAEGLSEIDCRIGCRMDVVWTRFAHPCSGLDCRMGCRTVFPKEFVHRGLFDRGYSLRVRSGGWWADLREG